MFEVSLVIWLSIYLKAGREADGVGLDANVSLIVRRDSAGHLAGRG